MDAPGSLVELPFNNGRCIPGIRDLVWHAFQGKIEKHGYLGCFAWKLIFILFNTSGQYLTAFDDILNLFEDIQRDSMTI